MKEGLFAFIPVHNILLLFFLDNEYVVILIY